MLSRPLSDGSTARPPRVGIGASRRRAATGGRGRRGGQAATGASRGTRPHTAARTMVEEEDEEERQAVVGSFQRWTTDLGPQRCGRPPPRGVRDGPARDWTASNDTTRPASTEALAARALRIET